MSHAKSKSKPDNSKCKSPPPPVTVYYTNVRGLEHLCARTTLTPFLSVKPTCMATSRTPNAWLLANPLQGCWAIHGLGIYVKSYLLIAGKTILVDENKFYVFLFGSSTFYYLHIFLVRG